MAKNTAKESKDIKETKSIYFRIREELNLTREEASELLVTISPEKLEKIENERTKPSPEDILIMAEKYRLPELCNHYCSHQCDIGIKYVPALKKKEFSQIILETVASLNSLNRKQERLIDIAADGVIDNDELRDFIEIQKELEKISNSVDSLKLWSEKMLASGKINNEKYNLLVNSVD